MENKKAKVTSVSFKKEFHSKKFNKPMFIFIVSFDNGDTGEYTSSNREQSFFKEGVECSYEKTTTQNGAHTDTSIKPFYADRSGGGGNGGGNFPSSRKAFEKNYKADFISFSAAYAKDLMVAGKLPKKKVGAKMEEMKFAECFEYIYSVMEKKLNEINKENNATISDTEQK